MIVDLAAGEVEQRVAAIEAHVVGGALTAW
jgi:hypothetical protein